MTLTDFLLARIAEDERDVPHLFDEVEIIGGQFVDLRARYVSECKARRRIMELLGYVAELGGTNGGEVARALALPYADHPDYREEWRP